MKGLVPVGYIKHHAIVVTGGGYPEADRVLEIAHRQAKHLFGSMVSNIVESPMNGYKSFFVAPDGSKERWDVSNEYDEKRSLFSIYLNGFAFEDGSSPIYYVEISYDENGKIGLERATNIIK